MKSFVRSLVVVGALGAATAASVPTLAAAPSSAGSSQGPACEITPPGAAHSEANRIVQLLDEALSGIKLNQSQSSTLGKLSTDVDEADAKVDRARRGLLLAIAGQLESGRIERNALEPKIGDFVDASEAMAPVVRHALDRLHDTLDAEQRRELAAGLERAIEDRAARYESQSWLDAWSRDLELTEQQKRDVGDRLEKLASSFDAQRGRIDRILAAFEDASFSAERFAEKGEARDLARKSADRIVSMADAIAQMLTPQQRYLAAKKIRENACGGAAGSSAATPSASSPSENTGSASAPLWGAYGPGYGVGYGTGYGYSAGYGRQTVYRSVNGFGYGATRGYGYGPMGGYAYDYPFVGGYGGYGVW
jgi:hypothetical protein